MLDNVKARLYDVLNNISGDTAGWTVTTFIIGLIIVNVIVAILDTVQELSQFQELFYRIEIISLAIFTVEYGLRLWTCTANKKYESPLKGRLLYFITPFALIDFVAIFPTYVALYAGVTAIDFLFLRSIRLLRVLRVFKLGRYNSAFITVRNVAFARRAEFLIVFFIAILVIIISASIMYLVEFHHPSGQFDSIPEAMWWAVETLTTVGYGDVVPITPLGKFLGAIIAFAGVAFIALPAGILGAGFIEEFQKKREKKQPKTQKTIQRASVADEIRKFALLRDDGLITNNEFEEQKAWLLKRS